MVTAGRDVLKKTLGLDAQVYHLNWSGDPLRPAFEPALYVPIHGEIVQPRDVRDAIEKSAGVT